MMKSTFYSIFLCAVVSCIWQKSWGLLYDPPVLDNPNSTIILNKGDNFTITCLGENREVTWNISSPGPLGDTVPEDHEIVFYKLPLQGNGNYGSQLNMTNVQYFDTGRYTCSFIDNFMLLNASVFIYVRDPENLFLGHSIMPVPLFVYTYNNRPAIIACRVSDPSIEVKLVKYTNQQVVSDHPGITYDPQIGFTIYSPTIQMTGNFECVSYINGTDTGDSIFVVLRYLKTSTRLPPVTIEVAPSASLSVSDTLTLTCKVKVNTDSLVTMSWSYPKSEENQERYLESITMRERIKDGDRTYDQILKKLEVSNVQIKDSGVYRCTIENFEKSAYREKVIYVYGKTFVYLMPGPDVEVVLGDSRAYLRFDINAYPKPELEWYYEDTKITYNRFYVYSQVAKAADLTIFQPTYKKMGKYTLKAYTPDMNSTSSMNLIVKGPPEAHWVGKPPEKPMAGSSIKFECQSYPLTDVVWLFNKCTPSNCTEWVNITDSDLKYRVSGTNPSQLVIRAEISGRVRCFVENEYGSSQVDAQFTVVDIPNGFGFFKVGHVTECDRLELECYGSLWIYKSLAILKVKDEEPLNIINIPTDNVTESDSEGYNVSDSIPSTAQVEAFSSIMGSTGYSIVRTALFERLSKKDSGVYQCFGLNLNGTLEKIQYPLKVQDSVKPTIDLIRSEMSLSLSIECRVQGSPTPSVTWYKDKHEMWSNNSVNITFAQRGYRIIIENASEVHDGIYTCEASNCAGTTHKNLTLSLKEKLNEAGFSKVYIGIIVGILVAIIIIIIIVLIFFKRMRTSLVIKMKDYEQYLLPPKGDYNPEIPIDEQTASIPYDPRWEFPKDRLRMGNVLGQGAFGRVIKTEAIGIVDGQDVTTVAVKMVKDCTDKEQMMALLSELKILIHIGQHLNILNLLGAVTKNIRFGELYVIVEYCHFGNVRSYLLKNHASFVDTMEDYVDPAMEKKRVAAADRVKPYYVNKPAAVNSADLIGPPLTTKNLICWSFQAARGMEYLSSKKYIHRDLAARNVLLSEDNVIKISDFGLAKDCYKNLEYKKKGDGPVPVKWMALESLTHKSYTSKSDVWSYGVLMYELFSLGGNPYSGIELNEKFVSLLKSGYRMERPPHASEEIYTVMLQCWDANPEKRPSFTNLVNIMGDYLEANVKQYYLDLTSPYVNHLDEACGEDAKHDGYLKMSGPTDISPITVKSKYTGEEPDDDVESARYVNQSRWNKEKADDFELQPLTSRNRESRGSSGAAPLKTKSDTNSPIQLRTRADIHCPDDTDSGHSSSYAPGTSPVDNNGYLEPKLLEETEKPLARHSSGYQGNSVLNNSPPPDYNAVMEENDKSALPV